jgi:hypothetical protein
MHELSLPTAEETSVKIKVGGAEFIIDYFDHQRYVQEAYTQMKVTGQTSNEVFASFVSEIYEKNHNIKISNGTAMVLLAEFDKIEEVLKKKFSSLQEVYDSSDSPGPQETTETSNS